MQAATHTRTHNLKLKIILNKTYNLIKNIYCLYAIFKLCRISFYINNLHKINVTWMLLIYHTFFFIAFFFFCSLSLSFILSDIRILLSIPHTHLPTIFHRKIIRSKACTHAFHSPTKLICTFGSLIKNFFFFCVCNEPITPLILMLIYTSYRILLCDL